MTTIVYKDGVIAYDSRMTAGSMIYNDKYNKRINQGGVSFFLTGAVADHQTLVDMYLNKIPVRDLESQALVYDKGVVYNIEADEGRFFITPLNKDDMEAIGSGSKYAYTAMDMGATAKEAVKMAMKRDTNTGGRIREVKLK